MARFVLVGNCNAIAGRDEEFNDWYWNTHFRQLSSIPCVISGRRFRLAEAQLSQAPQPYRYMGIFEIECEDPQEFFVALGTKMAAGEITPSTTVEEGSSLVMWQLMSQESGNFNG